MILSGFKGPACRQAGYQIVYRRAFLRYIVALLTGQFGFKRYDSFTEEGVCSRAQTKVCDFGIRPVPALYHFHLLPDI